MVLRQLQHLLAGLYDVDFALDVYDYLVTDRARLPPGVRWAATDEQLVVEQNAGDVAMSLFLDRRVLERLAAQNPLAALHSGNLADYWTALEGVSHFVYLAWHAGYDRPVSVHELEMQAEVDKYVTSLWLLRSQQPDRHPHALHSTLFERTRIDPQLAGERSGLYRRANGYAARFCRYLDGILAGSARDRDARFVAELRRFYRLSNTRKLEHIRRNA
ncbi:MAG: hypothetical protein WCE48_01800 [Steroidobacteraceae bacterium]